MCRLVVYLLAIGCSGIVAQSATSAPGFNSGIPGGSNFGGVGGTFDGQPFGSGRPCSQIFNETWWQNENQLGIERILITSDTMGNTFSSVSFTGGSNMQLDTWASQTCGQMLNLISYMKTACQASFGRQTVKNDLQDVVAMKKIQGLDLIRDYLCKNNQINLKEMAMNNGAQCARRNDQSDFSCLKDIQLSGQGNVFVPMLPNPSQSTRQMLKYGTSIVFSMTQYNGDECRYLVDLTNCIRDRYNRGGDYCSPRAAIHYSRVFLLALQGVQCSTDGISNFNNFDPVNSFNNIPSFNRYPSNTNLNSGFGQNNPNNFGQNNPNSFGQNSGSFGNNNNWPSNSGFGQGGFNQNNPNNFGQPGSGFGQGNFGQNNPNSFGQNSGSGNWANNPNNPNSPNYNPSFGSGSSFNNGQLPPYNPNIRRPYNSGNIAQSTAAIVVSALLAACLAL